MSSEIVLIVNTFLLVSPERVTGLVEARDRRRDYPRGRVEEGRGVRLPAVLLGVEKFLDLPIA